MITIEVRSVDDIKSAIKNAEAINKEQKKTIDFIGFDNNGFGYLDVEDKENCRILNVKDYVYGFDRNNNKEKIYNTYWLLETITLDECDDDYDYENEDNNTEGVIYLIESISKINNGTKTILYSGRDISHVNFYTPETKIIGDYELFVAKVCTPLSIAELLSDPNNSANILRSQLATQNFLSQARLISSVTSSGILSLPFCSCGSPSSILSLLQSGNNCNCNSCYKLALKSIREVINLKEIILYLKNYSNNPRCIVYYNSKTECAIKFYINDSYDIAFNINEDCFIRQNKNIYTSEKIEPMLYDCFCNTDIKLIGCGSAGSNIAMSLARTNIIRDMILIDKDRVESKNISNQVYTTVDTGCSKVYCLSCRIHAIKNDLIPQKSCAQILNTFQLSGTEKVNAKYTVLALDNIHTRREYMDKYLYTNDKPRGRKKCRSRYIIDTRFLNLECSIFIVDTQNESELKYYYDNLERACADIGNERRENTCQHVNIIDIYQAMASIVTGQIRNIETGKDKTFTHLELDTSSGIPQTLVMKK